MCGPGKSHIVGTVEPELFDLVGTFFMGFRVRSGNSIYCFLQYKIIMLMEGLHKMCLSVIVHIYTASQYSCHIVSELIN